MKLAEALVRRKDLVNAMDRLKNDLTENALAPEGQRPEEEPDELRRRLSQTLEEWEGLVLRINRTNLCERIDRGLTLQEAIVRRDRLAREHRVLTALREASRPRNALRRRPWTGEDSDEKLAPTVGRLEVRDKLDELAAEHRRLDIELQEANWRVELAE